MLQLQAPAKVNWFLKVLGKRQDGYHNILSLMQKISLQDLLIFEELKNDIVVEGDFEIEKEKNLVYRASVLLRKHSSCQKGARIILKKAIPVEAGLGGGSSDAAMTLLGLNRLWGLRMGGPELLRLGALLGSDVPFFISSSPLALVKGRGDVVVPMAVKTLRYWLLLLKPPFGVSTAEAYSSLNLKNGIELPDVERLLTDTLKALQGDTDLFRRVLQNDLEEVVFEMFPELRNLKNLLTETGALGASLAGSGSTVFGVFPQRQDAVKAAERIKQEDRGLDFLICHTL